MTLRWNDLASQSEASADFAHVPKVGWQLLMAWMVAETVSPTLVRLLPERQRGTVTQYDNDSAGVETSARRELSDVEQAEFEDAINDYLVDSGVPVLPRHVSVHLRLPAVFRDMDGFCEAVQSQMPDSGSSHPSATAMALRVVVPRFYG